MGALEVRHKREENLKDLIKKVKIPDVMAGATEKAGNIKTITKELEEKRNETAKVYGFIGMEVYDLSKENKIEIAQMKHYLDKLDALNQEIEELEKQRADLEAKNAGKNICACGYKLKPQDHFCPNCGEVIATVCVCGAKLKKNMKFCHVCGRSVEEIQKAEEAEKPMRECICGAKVPQGQFMCFECGRKIE